MVHAFLLCMHPEVVLYIGFLMLLCAGITYLLLWFSFKYSHREIYKIIVTKLKQRSQSAGNFIKYFKVNEKTSETLCDKSVIKNISVHVPTHLKPKNDTEFGHYLAGLIDGDGHFSKQSQLIIVFKIIDASLAYYIKTMIGYGNIYKVKHKKAIILVLSKNLGIKRVLNLINGKIRSKNKLDQIKNNLLCNSNYNIFSNFCINTDIDLNNHWLSGFSDASNARFKIELITKTNQIQTFALASQGLGLNKNLTPKYKTLPETRIVVWGQVLFSSLGLGRFTQKVSNMIRIPAYQESVITGLMLSDVWLTFGSKTNKSARLGFKQSFSHFGYFWFVFSILSHYCSSFPTLITSTRKETKTYALQILTRSLPCFTVLHAIYYPNGIKTIPADIFYLLTPVALAHWISGGGTKNRHGLTISTESFSINDTVKLLNVLMIRYRLDCSLRKHSTGYNIYIKEKSMPLLRTLVQSYMHSSMLYKLRIDPEENHTNQVNESKDKTSFQPTSASFQIKLITRKLNQKIEVRLNFQIDQKKNDLLILIKKLFGGNIGYRKDKNTYYYGSTSFGSAKNVIKYFDQYHLLSSKHVSFLKWRKAYIIIKNKDHLIESGLLKIIKLKKTINKNYSEE
jgi:hypothetical protein